MIGSILEVKDIIPVLEMDGKIDLIIEGKKEAVKYQELYKYSDLCVTVIKTGENGRLYIYARR